MLATLTAILTAVVLLFGGTGATALASQDALPGDTLYPVKTYIEDLQLSLTTNAEEEFRLHLGIAHERLDEIGVLIEAERYDDIAPVLGDLKHHLVQANAVLDLLWEQDPTLAAELAGLMTAFLEEFQSLMEDLLETLPDDVRDLLEDLLDDLELDQDDLLDDDDDLEDPDDDDDLDDDHDDRYQLDDDEIDDDELDGHEPDDDGSDDDEPEDEPDDEPDDDEPDDEPDDELDD